MNDTLHLDVEKPCPFCKAPTTQYWLGPTKRGCPKCAPDLFPDVLGIQAMKREIDHLRADNARLVAEQQEWGMAAMLATAGTVATPLEGYVRYGGPKKAQEDILAARHVTDGWRDECKALRAENAHQAEMLNSAHALLSTTTLALATTEGEASRLRAERDALAAQAAVLRDTIAAHDIPTLLLCATDHEPYMLASTDARTLADFFAADPGEAVRQVEARETVLGDALTYLVMLHDEIKDSDPALYEREKPKAWQEARDALRALDEEANRGRARPAARRKGRAL